MGPSAMVGSEQFGFGAEGGALYEGDEVVLDIAHEWGTASGSGIEVREVQQAQRYFQRLFMAVPATRSE